LALNIIHLLLSKAVQSNPVISVSESISKTKVAIVIFEASQGNSNPNQIFGRSTTAAGCFKSIFLTPLI
jgi:hypothetical protein